MKKIIESYKKVVFDSGFDINAGQKLDFSKTMKETIEDTVKYLQEGNKGCCFHASLYLIYMFHNNGIKSELVVTAEPTVLPDGTTRTDNRASVMYNYDGKVYIANPIEDIEYFEENGISKEERNKFYDYDSTILKANKNKVHSSDACFIEYNDYIKRYGDGVLYKMNDPYGDNYINCTLGEFLNKVEVKSQERI